MKNHKKISVYREESFSESTREKKSPYFLLKTGLGKEAFPKINLGKKKGKEIFKEWKI